MLLYKTIKAIRFIGYLFDTNTGKYYKLITTYGVGSSGYFLIKPLDDGRWLVVKQLLIGKKEDYNQLPYITRLRLNQFLLQKYGNIRSIQKIADSIDL